MLTNITIELNVFDSNDKAVYAFATSMFSDLNEYKGIIEGQLGENTYINNTVNFEFNDDDGKGGINFTVYGDDQ